MKKICRICYSDKFLARGEDRCIGCLTAGIERGSLIIGIDPDCQLSGYAEWDMRQKRLTTVSKFSFFEIFELLESQREEIALVRIEAGWLNNKSNFHGRAGQSKAAGERIAKNVGSNHETGRKLVEMANYLDLKVEEVRPIGTKSIDSEMFKKISGWESRTNQDMRDAALLVLKYK